MEKNRPEHAHTYTYTAIEKGQLSIYNTPDGRIRFHRNFRLEHEIRDREVRFKYEVSFGGVRQLVFSVPMSSPSANVSFSSISKTGS